MLLPFLTFKNWSFMILSLGPGSMLTERQQQHPFLYDKNVYYKFLYFLRVHFIGTNFKVLIFLLIGAVFEIICF